MASIECEHLQAGSGAEEALPPARPSAKAWPRTVAIVVGAAALASAAFALTKPQGVRLTRVDTGSTDKGVVQLVGGSEFKDMVAGIQKKADEEAPRELGPGNPGDTLKTIGGLLKVTNPVAVASYAKKSLALRRAACSLNIVQATNYLARAGVQIDQAAKTCKPEYSSTYQKMACTANAAGIFSSVAWVAAYISLSVSQCAKVPNIKAVCAATIEGVIAALGGVAVQANFVAANCGANAEAKAAANTATDAIWQMESRRLQGAVFPPDRSAEVATCILDVTEASTALAQMGLNIQSAARGCPLFQYTKSVPVVRKNTHAICALEIGHILYSAGQAAMFLAAAASHCSEGINVQALCASGVTGLITTLAGVVYLGSGMDLACTELPKLGPLQKPIAKLLGQGIARRLSLNETDPVV